MSFGNKGITYIRVIYLNLIIVIIIGNAKINEKIVLFVSLSSIITVHVNTIQKCYVQNLELGRHVNWMAL